jgi:hypothetical protein
MTTLVSTGTIGTGKLASGEFVSITIPGSAPVTLAVGDFFVMVVSKLNEATVDGATTEVASVSDTLGVIQWSRVYEYCNANGAANAGVTVSLWVGEVTAAYTGAGTFTANTSPTYTNAITATLWRFSGITAAARLQWMTPVVTSTVDAGAIASVASGTLPSREYLFVRAEGIRGNSTSWTKSAGWTSILTAVNQSSAISVGGEFNIVTGTSATSNPTNSGSFDRSTVLAAIYQVYQPYSYALGWAF